MILRRYIHREIAEKLGWIIGLLLLIIMSNRFVRYLADAAAGSFPADLVFQALLMKMLTTLPKLMPIAVFLAVLLGLSRLARDRELTAVSVAGGVRRVELVSIFQFSLLFSLIVFATSFYISPWAAQNTQDLRTRAEAEADTAGIAAGKFNEMSKGERVIYIEQSSGDSSRMENVFLQARQGQQTSVINSNSASYRDLEAANGKFILFENGRRYTGSRDSLDYRITRYRTYAVLVEQGDAEVDTPSWNRCLRQAWSVRTAQTCRRTAMAPVVRHLIAAAARTCAGIEPLFVQPAEVLFFAAFVAVLIYTRL